MSKQLEDELEFAWWGSRERGEQHVQSSYGKKKWLVEKLQLGRRVEMGGWKGEQGQVKLSLEPDWAEL